MNEVHDSHDSCLVEKDLDVKRLKISSKIEETRSQLLESNFNVIQEFQESFERDYLKEKQKITREFEACRKYMYKIEEELLNTLEETKATFINQKFKLIFEKAEKVGKNYYKFYDTKEACHFLISFQLC